MASSVQQWLIDHSGEVNRYLDALVRKRFISYQDQPLFWDLFIMFPEEAVALMHDFYAKNDDKLFSVFSSIMESEYVLSIAYGDPGKGKTALNYFLLDNLHRLDPSRSIYVMGTWIVPPFAKKILYDLNDIPSHSYCYIAEMGKFFPSRESSSQDNRQISSHFLDLRHFDIKILGETQKASSCDINVPRFASHKFFKFMDPMNLRFERVEVLNRLTEQFIPKDRSNKAQTLAICNGQYFTFNSSVPDWYTSDFSVNLSKLTEQDKLDYAASLVKKGYSEVDVMQKLLIHLRYSKDRAFWHQFYLEHK